MTNATDMQKTCGVRFPPPFYYLIGIVAGVILSRIYPKSLVPIAYENSLRIAAVIASALAIVLVVMAPVTISAT